MKARLLILATLAGASAHADLPVLSTPVQNALTTIDSQPTVSEINSAFDGEDPVMALTMIVESTSPATGAQVGIRVSAIRDLGQLGSGHDTILALLADSTLTTATDGSNLLVLRAAIETLGQLKVQADWKPLVDFLSHPSRDIRTSAARALSALQSYCAIAPLRNRYQEESTDQVRFAISDALAQLAALPPELCN
ncbi:MAG TPA: HEAT repeat domain-containing protein [Kofleriaceae bacterium]|jgi:hypothetical protein